MATIPLSTQYSTTDKSVSKYKQDQTPLFTFCSNHNKLILHLFWERQKVKCFLGTSIMPLSKNTNCWNFFEWLFILFLNEGILNGR